ncbi:MAG: formylglycine-generating enzyme family protein, partial [Thermoguttaceae bacterium]|nr:formylglycine-generating enzyme family protein [Thermoguttaceae bacterium]
LPTEAQWEYACMAGTTGERYGELDAIAWYGDNSDGVVHEVGQKKANAWGLYDMLGNVLELCSDWYGDYPMKNLTDYTGPEKGSDRVIRGGGCGDDAEDCSRSYRVYWYIRRGLLDWDVDLGFRLALVPKE